MRRIETKRGNLGRRRTARYSALLKRAAVLVQNDERLIDELVSIMHERQLSEEDVARRMGVALAELQAIEGGTADPTMGTVRRLAHAVGVTVSHHVEKDSTPTKTAMLWSRSGKQLSSDKPKAEVSNRGISMQISVPPYGEFYMRKESAV